MSLYKFRLTIVLAFMGIFLMKMVISAAPVFIDVMDKDTITAVILQLEQEHHGDGDCGKDLLKYTDCKPADLHLNYSYIPVLYYSGIRNCHIDHVKRYIDPFHAAVPTPPPDLS